MSQLPSSDQSTPPATSADVTVVEPGFETIVHAFWEKNRKLILMACVAVLLVIVGRSGWQYYAAMREDGVKADYAKAAEQPEKLAAFAEANAGHVLAGIAYLQLADLKFEAADYKQAGSFYTKASGSLKNEVLVGRARLGVAMSQLGGGDKTSAEAALKGISADQALYKDVRAEAAYHLATFAVAAGNHAEATKLIAEISKIDLGGSWSQRATMLQANLPTEAKSGEAATSGVSFQP